LEEGHHFLNQESNLHDNVYKFFEAFNTRFMVRFTDVMIHSWENIIQHANEKGAVIAKYDPINGRMYLAALDEGSGFPLDEKGDLKIMQNEAGYFAQYSDNPDAEKG